MGNGYGRSHLSTAVHRAEFQMEFLPAAIGTAFICIGYQYRPGYQYLLQFLCQFSHFLSIVG